MRIASNPGASHRPGRLRSLVRMVTVAGLLSASSACSAVPGASSLPEASGSNGVGFPLPSTTPAATPSPTGSPSVDPSPSSSDVFPSGLSGAAWTVYANDRLVVGTVGRPNAITLPAGRTLLAVVADIIVSSQVAEDGSQSTIYLTSRLDGSEVAPATRSPGQISVGAAAGDQVLATGMDADGKGDPGVIAISVSDGSIEQVIKPGSADVGSGPVGRNIAISPSQAHAVSSICTLAGCTGATVIDVKTRTVTHSFVSERGASGLDDDVILMRSGGDVTKEIQGVSIDTGKELWRESAGEYYQAYFTSDGQLVIALSEAGAKEPYRLIAIKATTGERRLITAFDTLVERTLWPELSTDTFAVVGDGGTFPGTVADGKTATGSTVDLATGEVTRAAVKIDIEAVQ